MKVSIPALLVFVAFAVVASETGCGGDVSIGKGTSALGNTDGDGADAAAGGAGANGAKPTFMGQVLCPASDCSNQGQACDVGVPTNLRCVEDGAGYPTVGNRCLLKGDCADKAICASGAALPNCPRDCDSFPMAGGCAAGDVCRLAGDTIGSQCTCLATSDGGKWQCSTKSKAPEGCTAICQ